MDRLALTQNVPLFGQTLTRGLAVSALLLVGYAAGVADQPVPVE